MSAHGALFAGASLRHADLSHADVEGADFSDTDLWFADLHAIREKGTIWVGSSRITARPADVDRLEAEGWAAPAKP
jgi:uncharacterized protein YjbI with pentapeptide repeats